MPWGADHAGTGNLISFAQSQTTLSSATAVGATSLSVTSVIGFAVGSVVHIGAIGAAGGEPSMVTAINGATNQLTLNTGLLNAHAAGEAVLTSPANHRNNFGGTSSATPLCAGLAALVLSANPSLTYIEARQILRDTAFKFDLANTDPVGQWLDANGNPSVTSGLPAVKSGWYGYGRVDAAAAVKTQSRLPPVATLSFAITSPTLALGPLPVHSGTVRISGAEQRRPGWTRALCRLTTLLKGRTRILYAVNPTGSIPGTQ
jgi:subtilisin family serine protease